MNLDLFSVKLHCSCAWARLTAGRRNADADLVRGDFKAAYESLAIANRLALVELEVLRGFADETKQDGPLPKLSLIDGGKTS